MQFPTAAFPVEVVRQIAEVLSENGLSEISLESPASGEENSETPTRLRLTRQLVVSAPVASPYIASSEGVEIGEGVAAAGATSAPTLEKFEVTSPCVGIFRAPRKSLQAGDAVKARQIVGAVESLKVLNEVYAPWDGVVVEILAFEGQAIEWGQPLLILEPSS